MPIIFYPESGECWPIVKSVFAPRLRTSSRLDGDAVSVGLQTNAFFAQCNLGSSALPSATVPRSARVRDRIRPSTDR